MFNSPSEKRTRQSWKGTRNEENGYSLCSDCSVACVCLRSAASKIAAAEVSRSAYSNTSCKTLSKQLYTVETRLGNLSAAQKAEANKDAAWVAGGALLFFPAMIVAATGEDHAGEIATLKGKKNAISEQMIMSNC